MDTENPTESTGSPSASVSTNTAGLGLSPQEIPIREAGRLSGDRTQTPVTPQSAAGWLRSLETPAERLARRKAWARYWNAIDAEAKRRNESGFYGPYGK